MIEAMAGPMTEPTGLIVVDGLIVQCCYCGAWKTFFGYREPGPVYHGSDPIEMARGRYVVSHGACPECRDVEMAKIRRDLGHRGRAPRRD